MNEYDENPQDALESVVYGVHPVTELVNERQDQIDRIYFDMDKKSAPVFELLKLCRKLRLTYQNVPAIKLDYLARTTKHQGVVALCMAKSYYAIETLLSDIEKKPLPGLLFIPASIEDPGNLGSLIRSCVAFGVDGILLERKNTAPLGETVAKSSAGMLEHIPVVKPRNLEGIIVDLKAKGFTVVGALHNAPTRPDQVDFTKPSIIITGGEHRDIPPYLLRLCDVVVGIPITSSAQSLNVTVAGSVLLYECAKQRNFSY